MNTKPPAKIEQPTSAKHPTVRFNIGSLTKAKDGRVVDSTKLWSKEVEG